MEEKKFDLNSMIGMFLLAGLAMLYLYQSKPSEEELELKKATEIRVKDSIAAIEKAATYTKDPVIVEAPSIAVSDSLAIVNTNSKKGTFGYSATLPSAKANETIIKNDLLEIKVSNKGGYITSLRLNNYKTYDQKELFLIKDNNASLDLTFQTKDGRNLHTKEMYFEPSLSTSNGNQVLSMKLKVDATKYLEYKYILKPNDYMLDFNISSVGLSNAFNTSEKVNLNWHQKVFRTEKSIRYENQYTDLHYLYEGDEADYLSVMSKEDDATEKDINWIAFHQQFFTSVLLTEKPFGETEFKSKNLVQDEKIDTVFLKQFDAKIPLNFQGNELNSQLQFYYGPADYKLLNTYEDKHLDRILPLGWGLFRWINVFLIIPLFGFLGGIMGNLGWAIVVLTIIVKLVMSPLLYKSFLSSAKMKVIKPEIQEINDRLKGKENAMKRQQETMALQRKAGVSPMAGCVPALLQMPIFFALFRFFPSAFELRQKSFLWAEDLSSYDEIARLPFNIPFYGSHVALFPILASITMFFYMKITQGQQANMQQPKQEGMPDMQGMMKIMLYISPFMMLFFFNSYGSGLSIYYFISQLISIGIMLVIKNYIIDEDKLHAQIQVNKKKAPKKKSAFRQRLDDAMKQAQEQQAEQKKGKKK
ncbi:MAG: membrane protein insertase YidC [Flavobacteriaceae bacterium]